MKNDLLALIVEIAREILESEGQETEALDQDTELFGKKGVFDSMGLVSLIVALEQEIEDRFGRTVALADEKALSRSSSPYRTVGTLAEYASEGLAST